MSRLTFDSIYRCLQSNGIRCYHMPAGIKVYSQYYHLGTFRAMGGQCIFTGNVPKNFELTQYYLHKILNLFKYNKVAYLTDDVVEYICHIKGIKETSDE